MVCYTTAAAVRSSVASALYSRTTYRVLGMHVEVYTLILSTVYPLSTRAVISDTQSRLERLVGLWGLGV
jgi:hypothetical protein